MIDYLLYPLLILIWGSSFFFTELALDAVEPATVVAVRMALGAAALTAVVWLRRPRLPSDRRTAGRLALMGAANIALPFTLLAAAQAHVTSSLAVVLSATTPIFVFLGCVVLRTESFSGRRLAGVGLAFAGVVGLSGPGTGVAHPAWYWPVLIVVSSAIFASGNLYTRRHLAHVDPLVTAWGQVVAAAAYLVPFALVTDGVPREAPGLVPALALVELGLLGSAVGYLLFFRFIQRWGSTAASFNTYLQPVVGVLLGVTLLGERLSGRQWAALAVLGAGLVCFAIRTATATPAAAAASPVPGATR